LDVLAVAVGAIIIWRSTLLWLFNPGSPPPTRDVRAGVSFLMRASMGRRVLARMLGEQTLCALVLVAATVLDAALCLALVSFLACWVAIATSAATAALMNYIWPAAGSGSDLDLG
jgi:hypothetical protein